MVTIQELYGLSDSFLQHAGVAKKKEFVCGAELEIEDVRDYSSSILSEDGIDVTEDGSLRNNGKEFLLAPSYLADSVKKFNFTHSHIELGSNPFSARTTVHVHVNCLYSTVEQVRTLLLLYAIFEPLAFSYAGTERKNNIHCMPLNSTYMPNTYHKPLHDLIDGWHKYTAFNLCPLRELGTVEFRHLGGTADPVRYEEWLKFINTLWSAAHDIGSLSKEQLTDLIYLRKLRDQLMTVGFVNNCLERPSYDLEDNLLDVKLAYI